MGTRLINEETKRRLGRHHNAPSLMITVDVAEVERVQHKGDWEKLATLLADSAQSQERGGADFVVLCTKHNAQGGRVHYAGGADTPLHIVDDTAAQIKQSGEKWQSDVLDGRRATRSNLVVVGHL